MNFTAWVIFCPVWMTLVYTVGAFSLWGGGWLSQLGVQDFSGATLFISPPAPLVSSPQPWWATLTGNREQFPPTAYW